MRWTRPRGNGPERRDGKPLDYSRSTREVSLCLFHGRNDWFFRRDTMHCDVERSCPNHHVGEPLPGAAHSSDLIASNAKNPLARVGQRMQWFIRPDCGPNGHHMPYVTPSPCTTHMKLWGIVQERREKQSGKRPAKRVQSGQSCTRSGLKTESLSWMRGQQSL